MKILTEASGSMTSGYLIKAIQDAGHIAVASDIDSNCFAVQIADEFILMPKVSDSDLWGKIEQLLVKYKIDAVIPSLDETLLAWAERKSYFEERGIKVILSDPEVVQLCQDKWLTHHFFNKYNIPTPKSSLEQRYPLIKPRGGRGGDGILITNEKIDMEGLLSQELVHGTEYTVDVFCDYMHQPIYIIPRRRLAVKEGKSTGGIVEKHDIIEAGVKKICEAAGFIGPINIQCFLLADGSIKYIEINPRIAGGMALGFAASENWMNLVISNLIEKRVVEPKSIKYGLEMRRYYAETFVSKN